MKYSSTCAVILPNFAQIPLPAYRRPWTAGSRNLRRALLSSSEHYSQPLSPKLCSFLPVRREEEVVVREHDPLRRARRPRGVHEAAALVHRHLALPRAQLGIQLVLVLRRSQGDDLPPAQHAGMRRLSAVLDYLLQGCDLVENLKDIQVDRLYPWTRAKRYREHFLQRRVVLDDENVGLGVVHDVGVHVRAVGRVEAAAEPAGEDGRQGALSPLRRVEAGYRHGVEPLQPDLDESSSNL